jgi:crotonobetainyl-CoA:carnitine CoA-transferase CaiB-like acyl-CoA transferase
LPGQNFQESGSKLTFDDQTSGESPPSSALAGVRVVEWGSLVSAPFCGKVLAELGAEVVKVEPPGSGDDSRRLGPFPDGEPDPERSGAFLFVNLNKQGITLDLDQASGRAAMDGLLESADVFLENQPPDVLARAGLDYETLSGRFPRLIVTSVSPYGRTGSYRDYRGCDLTANAMSGLSFGTGHPHREPLTTPMHQASYLAGVGGAFATLSALLGRDITGRGQLVDVAEAQVIGTLLTGYHLPTYIYRGVAGFRAGNRMRLGLFPNCVLPCKDGYVCIDAPQMEQYQRFLDLLGEQQWMDEPRYRDRRAMSDQYPAEAESLIAPWFMERTKEEILRACLENRVPCVPVKTFDEVLRDEQLNSRDYFQVVEHPAAGSYRYPGPPYRLSATPCRVVRPAPTLGQHNRQVLEEATRPPGSKLSTPVKNGAGQTAGSPSTGILPLSGYRVVDFGTAWAGPMAAQLLADLGAEVIKVESRARMDGLRLGRPIVGEDIAGGDRGLWPELQPVFHGINRNKLSITLNLKTGEGLGLARRLIASSDVVMNNYSPGVLERMGLAYPKLKELRPDIILVSMPSVGESGPMRDILAYAPIIQALSGLMSQVGYDGEEPLVGELQAPWSDVVAAVHAALAALAALRYRNLSGQGQFVEVAQLETTASMLGEGMLRYQMTGRTPQPAGNYDPDFAPHNNYRCAGDDQWVAIAVRTSEEWDGLRRAMRNPDWASDVRFANKSGRLTNIAELDRRVSEWTEQWPAEDLVALLQGHGVAAMKVMNIEDQFIDPHLQERGAYVEVEHPHVGIEWIYGMPWLLSDTPGGVRTPAPALGEHNDYVLGRLLGVPATELERLSAAQVVY